MGFDHREIESVTPERSCYPEQPESTHPVSFRVQGVWVRRAWQRVAAGTVAAAVFRYCLCVGQRFAASGFRLKIELTKVVTATRM